MNIQRGRGVVGLLLGTLGPLVLSTAFATASDGTDARQVAVTLKAGETYVIKDLSKASTPAVHVIDNPNALIVHSEAPGELAVLGTSEGEWEIDVKNADDKPLTYDISVKPAPSGRGPSARAAQKSGSTASLDKGNGPVTAAASSAEAGAPSTSAAHPAEPATFASSASASGTVPVVPAPAPAATEATSATGSTPAAAGPPGAEPAKLAEAAYSGAATSTNPASGTPPSTVPADGASSGAGAVVPTAATPPVPGSSMMTSQRAPLPMPQEKFRTDPMAVPSSPPEVVTGGRHYLPDDVIDLASGSSQIVDFKQRLRRIAIADTSVADLQVINPYQINLVGHKEGFTTIAIWDSQGNYEQRQIRVDPHGKQQVMLNVIVAELNRARLEGQGISWTLALPGRNISFVNNTSGVATPYSSSASLTPPIIINPGTSSATQINTSATGTLLPGGQLLPLLLSSNVSYALAAQNSDILTQTLFQFLEDHQMAKILAEPHLLANSGEKAEFLSGGEIPIVVAQALNTSIVFKQFGTSVIFVPTVVGKDQIGLQVKAEVSQPNFAQGVNLFGFTVPAFVTRRAETFVRLRNNQTLIIAGLILKTKNWDVNKTPYLADIPYLGQLFRHNSYTNNETDLVMSVTPQMVQPVPYNGQLALPTDRGPMTAAEIRTGRVYPQDTARPRF